MKTTKLIIFTIVMITFGMAANAFGQPGTKAKAKLKSHKSSSNARVKPHGTSNYSFGATQTGGGWFKSKNQQKTKGPTGTKHYYKVKLDDLLITSRRKPRKPRKH